MLKKLIILLLIVVPMGAIAQEAKFAHVNSQEIFLLMPELKDIEKKITAKQEVIRKQLAAIELEHSNKLQEFEKSPVAVSDAVLQDRQKQVMQIQERYQVFMQKSEKEIQELQQNLISPVQKKVVDAINSVGNEKGYLYIFDSATGSIAFHSPKAVDATPFVKAKLGIK